MLHQACEAALGSGLVPGGSALSWASHYQDRLSSDQSCLNEWMAMADLESLRPPSTEPGRPSEQEQMEEAVRAELWDVLDASDLESITSKEVGRALGGGRGTAGLGGGASAGPGLSSRRGLPAVFSCHPEPSQVLGLGAPVRMGQALSSEALEGRLGCRDLVRGSPSLSSFSALPADPPGPGAAPGLSSPTVPRLH